MSSHGFILNWTHLSPACRYRSGPNGRGIWSVHSEADRTKILLLTHNSSQYTKYQESGYKILTCWYRNPRVLHKMFPLHLADCWHCGAQDGHLLHVFWSCDLILPFWSNVCTYLKKFTNPQVLEEPDFCLLHHTTIAINYCNSIIPHIHNGGFGCLRPGHQRKVLELLVLLDRVHHHPRVCRWLGWAVIMSCDTLPLRPPGSEDLPPFGSEHPKPYPPTVTIFSPDCVAFAQVIPLLTPTYPPFPIPRIAFAYGCLIRNLPSLKRDRTFSPPPPYVDWIGISSDLQ